MTPWRAMRPKSPGAFHVQGDPVPLLGTLTFDFPAFRAAQRLPLGVTLDVADDERTLRNDPRAAFPEGFEGSLRPACGRFPALRTAGGYDRVGQPVNAVADRLVFDRAAPPSRWNS